MDDPLASTDTLRLVAHARVHAAGGADATDAARTAAILADLTDEMSAALESLIVAAGTRPRVSGRLSWLKRAVLRAIEPYSAHRSAVDRELIVVLNNLADQVYLLTTLLTTQAHAPAASILPSDERTDTERAE